MSQGTLDSRPGVTHYEQPTGRPLFLSDVILGFHSLVPWVYGSFVLIVCLGFWVRHKLSVSRLVVASFTGSVLFYLITNFGVWAALDAYPKNTAGLIACYVAGLPFLVNTALGDLFYAAILFGGMAMAERCWMTIRPHAVIASAGEPI